MEGRGGLSSARVQDNGEDKPPSWCVVVMGGGMVFAIFALLLIVPELHCLPFVHSSFQNLRLSLKFCCKRWVGMEGRGGSSLARV